MGDGELDCGQIWEAAMLAGKEQLHNLIGIVDRNGIQIDGFTKEVMNIEPVDKKFEAFGWQIIKIDSHDFKEIMSALDKADKIKDKPVMIIAETVKGKGVSCMENKSEWHGKACNAQELKECLKELN